MKPLFMVIEVYVRLKNGLSIDPAILCDDDEDTLLRMKSIKESFLRWNFDDDCKGLCRFSIYSLSYCFPTLGKAIGGFTFRFASPSL